MDRTRTRPPKPKIVQQDFFSSRIHLLRESHRCNFVYPAGFADRTVNGKRDLLPFQAFHVYCIVKPESPDPLAAPGLHVHCHRARPEIDTSYYAGQIKFVHSFALNECSRPKRQQSKLKASNISSFFPYPPHKIIAYTCLQFLSF